MHYDFLCNGATHFVSLEKKGTGFEVEIGGRKFFVDACKVSERLLSFIVEGRSVLVHMARQGGGWILGIGGRQYVLEDPAASEAERGASGDGGGGDGLVTTPMPGKVVEVLVKEGDLVSAGKPLLILESMKMQNEIAAGVAGVVKKVHFVAGDLASFGDPLVEIVPEETAET